MRTRDNAFEGLLADLKQSWRHRRGQEIPAAVLDTIDALWPDELKRPFLHKMIKQDNGWFFIIHLPPGRSYHEFKDKQNYIQDATGGAVQIAKEGKAVHMTVLTDELKTNYNFNWDPKKYDEMFLPIPFGYSAGGFVVRDLADAPNLLVAGVPGSGKSNFLHVVAMSALTTRDVYLCIIDRKKLEFAYLENHALVVTSNADALNLLQGINREVDKRLMELKKAGCQKIQDYKGEMPFIPLIIDELAELTDEDCQEELNRIVRLGRAAGICVVAATQRPSSTMFKKWGDSKAMFGATMCFYVRDGVNSGMVLGNDSAAIIPKIPGRAIYQWDVELEVQAMYLPVKKARKLLPDVKGVRFNAIQSPKRLLPR